MQKESGDIIFQEKEIHRKPSQNVAQVFHQIHMIHQQDTTYKNINITFQFNRNFDVTKIDHKIWLHVQNRPRLHRFLFHGPP